MRFPRCRRLRNMKFWIVSILPLNTPNGVSQKLLSLQRVELPGGLDRITKFPATSSSLSASNQVRTADFSDFRLEASCFRAFHGKSGKLRQRSKKRETACIRAVASLLRARKRSANGLARTAATELARASWSCGSIWPCWQTISRVWISGKIQEALKLLESHTRRDLRAYS